MTKLLAGALAVLGLGATAVAAPAPQSALSMAFGNTIVSTYPDHRTAELWLKPGGSYTAKGRRGDPSSGHWTQSGRKVCLKQAHPFAAPFKYCTAIPSGGVGASWTARAVTGETIRVKLVRGLYSGRA